MFWTEKLYGIVRLTPISIPECTEASRRLLANTIRESGDFRLLLQNVLGKVHGDVVRFCIVALEGQPTLQSTATGIGKTPERVRQIFHQLARLVVRKCKRGEWLLDLGQLPIRTPKERYRLVYILVGYLWAVRREYRTEFLGQDYLSAAEERLLQKLLGNCQSDFWSRFHRVMYLPASKRMQAEIVPRFLRAGNYEEVAVFYGVKTTTVEWNLRKITQTYISSQFPHTFNHRRTRSRQLTLNDYRWFLARVVIEFYYTDYRLRD